jgi:hypothetical protein
MIRSTDLSPTVRAKLGIVPKQRKRRSKPKPLERDDQEAYFSWLYHIFYGGRRLYDYAYAIPNGAFRGRDVRKAAIQTAYLLRQGMKRGVPDLNIDIPVAPYFGLRIEMKRIGAPKPEPGDDQSMWHARLREQGYCVAVCFGLKQAQAVTLEYFGLTGRYTI